MAITQLNPYLSFEGHAEQAIKHYEQALGAQVTQLMRMSDAPGIAAEHAQKVMHCELRIDGQALMVSDTMPGSKVIAADSLHVCLNFDSAQDMQKRFDALGVGGKINHPIHDTFWGAKFGMLTDKFGVHWMMNCENKQ
jgi:PhnB protein